MPGPAFGGILNEGPNLSACGLILFVFVQYLKGRAVLQAGLREVALE